MAVIEKTEKMHPWHTDLPMEIGTTATAWVVLGREPGTGWWYLGWIDRHRAHCYEAFSLPYRYRPGDHDTTPASQSLGTFDRCADAVDILRQNFDDNATPNERTSR